MLCILVKIPLKFINISIMRKLYLFLFLALVSPLSISIFYAQCTEATVESVTNPGPYAVATLTEADGIRSIACDT